MHDLSVFSEINARKEAETFSQTKALEMLKEDSSAVINNKIIMANTVIVGEESKKMNKFVSYKTNHEELNNKEKYNSLNGFKETKSNRIISKINPMESKERINEEIITKAKKLTIQVIFYYNIR